MPHIALGITGGIAAYKSVDVVRGLQRHGHDVTAIMTASATRFVGPLTFEAITRRRVITEQFEPGANADIEHVALATEIALLVVAPATANCIGKFAHGLADDFLSALQLATTAPVLVAPAMNTQMLAHDAVARNLRTLADRGVHIVEPGEGYLACGWVGKGRMAEPSDIVAAAQALLATGGTLAGRCVLVTAGPTYEDIDTVRYLGNRSSGRMGFAVASEALRRGARVLLVAGPTDVPVPVGAEVERVRNAAQMHDAVMAHVEAGGVDAVVMAAAVADYTPADGRVAGKLQKSDGDLSLRLTRTPDILATLGQARQGRDRPMLVGFAAEAGDPVARATQKLMSKQADLIVGNDISRSDGGLGSTMNTAALVDASGVTAVPLGTKQALAALIVDRIEQVVGRESWAVSRGS